jgi:hypothetical protein
VVKTFVPFICKKCGKRYGERGIAVQGDAWGISLADVGMTCPHCGTPNPMALADGKYNVRDGRWEIVSQVARDIVCAQPTADEIRRLAEIAREARANGGDVEQIATAIENGTSFGRLAETIRKANREHSPGWGAYVLGIILSVIGAAFPYILSAITSPTAAPSTPPPAVTRLSPEQIDQIAQQVAQGLEGQYGGSAHKVARNVPCQCGSGIKHKKCCGDPSKRTANRGVQDTTHNAA